jgi:RNA recognition motif-containing protein
VFEIIEIAFNLPLRRASTYYTDQETAIRAVKELDGLEVMGRQLRADHAVKKEPNFAGNGRRDKPDAW